MLNDPKPPLRNNIVEDILLLATGYYNRHIRGPATHLHVLYLIRWHINEAGDPALFNPRADGKVLEQYCLTALATFMPEQRIVSMNKQPWVIANEVLLRLGGWQPKTALDWEAYDLCRQARQKPSFHTKRHRT